MNQARHRVRLLVGAPSTALMCVLAVAGCGEPMAPVVAFPDGTYELRATGPQLLNEFVTPSWMWSEPSIVFEKAGPVVRVVSSENDLVAEGRPQFFQRVGDTWVAHISWVGKQDGDHYWLFNFDDVDCREAVAVDADLGIGPGGVWEVELARCTITAIQ